MARFNSFSVMVAFFLASVAVMAQDSDIFPPAPSNDDFYDDEGDMPPEPAPALRAYLDSCAIKLTGECGDEIFKGIFRSGNYSDDCCHKLVVMGKPCNDAMVKFIISIPEMNVKASDILPKSEQVWNKCVSVVAALAPTPSPSS